MSLSWNGERIHQNIQVYLIYIFIILVTATIILGIQFNFIFKKMYLWKIFETSLMVASKVSERKEYKYLVFELTYRNMCDRKKIESVWNRSLYCFIVIQKVCLFVFYVCVVYVCACLFVCSVLFVHPSCIAVYFSLLKKLILFALWREKKKLKHIVIIVLIAIGAYLWGLAQ